MKQPYIGNTKINKLYKGSELWRNWNSSGGGDTPIEPSIGYVTDNLMICCDAYGKTSSDTFDGFYDSINNKKFNLSSGTANYETNCLNLDGAYLIYGDGVNEYGKTLKMSLKNTTFELVFKCGSYTNGWRTIFTIGNYNTSPFSLKSSLNRYAGNKLLFLMSGTQSDRKSVKCLDKTKFWNHFIISIDNNGVGKIFINGEYLGNCNIKNYDNNSSLYNLGLYFGYNSSGDVPLMSIGCFRYYNKALSETEVVQNYNHEQTINRITTLNFPALDDSYENADPPIIDRPGEMNKGGIDSE